MMKFQNALSKSALAGFRGSVVSRIDNATWLPLGSESYEEWYLVDGSDILDPLNEVAVSNSRKEPHDDAAHMATDMRAGLYKLRLGEESSVDGRCITWLSKPKGTDYEQFYDQISKVMTNSESSLWRRQMVLGPTSEFCVITKDELSINTPEFNPVLVKRNGHVYINA